MTRKEVILKHLRKMGYRTAEDDGVITVALGAKDGRIYATSIFVEEVHNDSIIESVVREINELIINPKEWSW